MSQKNIKTKLFIFTLLFTFSLCYYIQEGNDPSTIITNFSFGSDYYGRNTKKNNNIFKTILKHNPNFFIWLGNSVYLDKPKFNILSEENEKMDWDFIKKAYYKVKTNKYYSLLNQQKPILGTWGDHEYGVNFGNEANSQKESYKQYYLDFLDVDTLDQRREKTNIGMYSTYSFGKGYKTIRIILLDLKYNKTAYLSGETNDMLGDVQWKWLENIFKNFNETYTFICTSNQLLSYDRYISQKWYKESRKKIFDLVGKYKRRGVIFLSGGNGFAQISKTFCPLPKIGYNLYEITSSGLGYSSKVNSFFSNIYHNDYLIEGQNYDGINFGEVQIYWGQNINSSFVNLQIYDDNDEKKLQVFVNYTDLIYNDNEDYYEKEENVKNIKYMNIYDGKSCEREIYHRVRTPFMSFKYYITHPQELPIAIITIVIIIVLTDLLVKKKFIFVLGVAIISFICYFLWYMIRLNAYLSFKNDVKSIEME